MQQLELFEWVPPPSPPSASTHTAEIIDAMPALIRKAAIEAIYRIPNRVGGEMIPFRRTA